MRRALHVHIDRLVVEGVAVHEGSRFKSALEVQLTEMARTLEPAMFERPLSRAVGRVVAGQMHSGGTAERAAAQITNAVRAQIVPGEVNRRA